MTTPILSPIPDGFKRCTKCGEVKPVTEFHLNSRNKLKHESRCKFCVAAQAKQDRARANPNYKPRPTQDGVPEGYKRCGGCDEIKPRDAFSKHKRNKDSLQTQCKACNKQYLVDNAERVKSARKVYYTGHKENIREYLRATREQRTATHRVWIAAHPGYCARKCKEWATAHPFYKAEYRARNIETIREREREQYWANRSARLEKSKAYHEANKDTILARKKEYAKTEEAREKAANRGRSRRIRIRGVTGNYTSDDLPAIRAAQTDKRGRLICWACGKPIIGNNPPPHIPGGTPMPPHLDHWIPIARDGKHDAGNLHFMHGLCNIAKGAKMPTEIGRLI